MNERKLFYQNAFEENGQNALIDYLVEHDISIYESKFKEKIQKQDLDPALAFAIKYHSYACAHLTKNWLKSEIRISPQDLARMMYLNMPAQLREATLY